ncbi:ATP-binding protein [Pseudozobellia thermophila]|nr:ATP-binding protein [Pseudozobellia thermophila]
MEKRVKNDFIFKQYPFQDSEEDLFIQDIIETSSNVLGLATKYNGYVLFDTQKEKYISSPNSVLPISADVRVLQQANDKSIWLGTTQGVRIIGSENEIFDIKSNESSLSQNFIKAIYKDKHGTIWLGTYSGGVNIWDPSNENFNHLKNSKLANSVVTAIISDKRSNLIYGTEGGDVAILNHKKSTSKVYSLSDKENLIPNSIQTLFLVDDNLLWAGVLNYGLLAFDLRSNQIVEDFIPHKLMEYLKTTGVFSIKQGAHGIYWIGTFGKGLVRYDSGTEQFRVYGKWTENKPKLSSNIIKTICVDQFGNIWAGGLGGLNLLKFRNEEKDDYEVFHFFIDAFSGNDIKTVYEDRHGIIWVGTKTLGLYRFNGSEFEHVNLNEENPISTIHTILEDAEGHIWLSSDKGIVRYNRDTHKTTIYDQRNILSSNDFSPNAGIIQDDGNIYFGGNEGLTLFNPKKLVKNMDAPPVILSDLQLKNNSVTVDAANNILSKSISYTDEITLSHDNANFSLHFAMPSYINSKNNQYAYRLVGLDDSWTYTSHTEAYYTLQKPGEYLFEVKGANNDGIWNESPTSLKITVLPAPWKSIWAFMLYGILGGVTMYYFYNILKSRAKLKQDLRWEQLENKRKEENHEAKLRFFTNISHDFRTPLTLILGPLQQILNNYKGSSIVYKKLLVIESSANHLLHLINRLMEFRKLEDNQSKLQVAEGNIVKFVNEIFLSFTEFAKGKGYNYTFKSSRDEILVFYDRPKLEQVFYNLLSNAFKYTPEGGEISITIDLDQSNIYFKIQDSGIGIKKEYLEQIFNRFFEVPHSTGPDEVYNKGTGIGLSIVKNIIDLHKGSIKVSSKLSEGSVFTISLPLGKNHLKPDEIIPNFKFSDDITQYTNHLTDIERKTLLTTTDNFTIKKELPTILIVEDNDQLRAFFKNLLSGEYNIMEAEDGEIGLSKALQFLPDLVISDVMMPKMAGTELCAQLKHNLKTSHIPIILLTARTSLFYKFKGLESGADDYISKPFHLREFKLRIKNLLDSSRRLREKFTKEPSVVPSELTITSLDEKLLTKAMHIVETNLGNHQFDINSFAKELGVSRTMLFTKIKAWTNHTPNEFINELRLKKAAVYFETSNMNISEISYKVGFNNPKYFSKCFQKKYNMTPSQYIKKFS